MTKRTALSDDTTAQTPGGHEIKYFLGLVGIALMIPIGGPIIVLVLGVICGGANQLLQVAISSFS